MGHYSLKSGPYELTQPQVVHQVVKVLRLKPGEELILCDGLNHEAIGAIESISPRSVRLSLQTPRTVRTEPRIRITLYCAVLKKENFDLVVQKTTEIGASAIVPIITRRTIKQNLNLARLRSIALEAAELSGRGKVPTVEAPLAWGQALDHAKANAMNVVYDFGYPALGKDVALHDDAGIFIGPEGGWHEAELAEARTRHFHVAGLGPLTFRAETAAMVAVYSMVKLTESPLSELPSAK